MHEEKWAIRIRKAAAVVFAATAASTVNIPADDISIHHSSLLRMSFAAYLLHHSSQHPIHEPGTASRVLSHHIFSDTANMYVSVFNSVVNEKLSFFHVIFFSHH